MMVSPARVHGTERRECVQSQRSCVVRRPRTSRVTTRDRQWALVGDRELGRLRGDRGVSRREDATANLHELFTDMGRARIAVDSFLSMLYPSMTYATNIFFPGRSYILLVTSVQSFSAQLPQVYPHDASGFSVDWTEASSGGAAVPTPVDAVPTSTCLPVWLSLMRFASSWMSSTCFEVVV